MSPGAKAGAARARLRRAQGAVREAVRWVTEHLDAFTPSDGLAPEELKPATELAMFYGFTAGWSTTDEPRRLMLIRDFLVDLYSRRELAVALRQMPSHFSHYATGYLALRAGGVRIAEFEESIRIVLENGYPFVLENTPYREISMQYSLWKAGLRARPPSFGRCFRATSLGRIRNPVYLSASEAYSITHTLFYVTDIAGPAPGMPATERARALGLVEPLLVHYWRLRDWDLTGELLLNLVALDRSNTPAFDAAFDALLGAQRIDGTVPGPHFVDSDARAPARVFNSCYHTTLVAMFLGSAFVYRAS